MGVMTPRIARASVSVLALTATCTAAAGCGLNVASPDLFVLHRAGQGQALTLLVNDSGTIRCNGSKAKPLPDPLLLDARDLATDLDKDAKAGLHLPPARNSAFFYTVKLQDGTITFSDTGARTHPELARAEQFALQAAQGPCGLPG